jgi:hypothetical protein
MYSVASSLKKDWRAVGNNLKKPQIQDLEGMARRKGDQVQQTSLIKSPDFFICSRKSWHSCRAFLFLAAGWKMPIPEKI